MSYDYCPDLSFRGNLHGIGRDGLAQGVFGQDLYSIEFQAGDVLLDQTFGRGYGHLYFSQQMIECQGDHLYVISNAGRVRIEQIGVDEVLQGSLVRAYGVLKCTGGVSVSSDGGVGLQGVDIDRILAGGVVHGLTSVEPSFTVGREDVVLVERDSGFSRLIHPDPDLRTLHELGVGFGECGLDLVCECLCRVGVGRYGGICVQGVDVDVVSVHGKEHLGPAAQVAAAVSRHCLTVQGREVRDVPVYPHVDLLSGWYLRVGLGK